MWMLSRHCEISLIHASLSWMVGAIRWIPCRVPDLDSTKILKSRLPALTDSVTLNVLPRVDAEQTEASSSSCCTSLGSSTSVASASGIFPTSGSRCKRPPEVRVAMIMWLEKRKHCRTASRSLLNDAKRLRIRPRPGGTCTKLPCLTNT
uniref:Putative secreted protein n=1 Tax=Anopheles darlingi TaxID=43151 RepID=A0A2M4DA22_ANODA